MGSTTDTLRYAVWSAFLDMVSRVFTSLRIDKMPPSPASGEKRREAVSRGDSAEEPSWGLAVVVFRVRARLAQLAVSVGGLHALNAFLAQDILNSGRVCWAMSHQKLRSICT